MSCDVDCVACARLRELSRSRVVEMLTAERDALKAEVMELRAEMEGWKEEAGDAEELKHDNERLRGELHEYQGDDTAVELIKSLQAHLTELCEAAEAAYDWAEKHGEETCTAFERLEAVLAKLTP